MAARADRQRAYELDTRIAVVGGGDIDMVINRVWTTAAVPGAKPQRDRFLVMEITLYNYGDKALPLVKYNFPNFLGERRAVPEKMSQVGEAYYPGVQYPPADRANPHRMPALSEWETFLVYDMPAGLNDVAFAFEPPGAAIPYGLILQPREDGEADFLLAQVDNVDLVRIGDVTFFDSQIERIVDVETVALDNCMGTTPLSQEVTRSRELNQIEGSSQAETRQSSLQAGPVVPIPFFRPLAAAINLEVSNATTETDFSGEFETRSETQTATLSAAPGTLANYQLVWYLASQEGALEVYLRDKVYAMPFVVGSALRMEVKALPPSPCEGGTPPAGE